MGLEHFRKYSTYFHLSLNYGVSKSTTYKIIRWIED
ncbi:MAG: transposase family protein [Verrucomicrobia bacterium]|nr:transposase family protein [Verrucomicrobiota bacterium]